MNPLLPQGAAVEAAGGRRASVDCESRQTPSDTPLSADMAYTLNPGSLTPLMDGPFVFWDDPYANPGSVTILKSHLDGGGDFAGLGAAFADGHAQWRSPGLAGPRTGVLTSGGSYDYVQWY